jgi:hypothetical protein
MQKRIIKDELKALKIPEHRNYEIPGGWVDKSSVSLVAISPVLNLRKNL